MIELAHRPAATNAPRACAATVACVIVNHGSAQLAARAVASVRATAPAAALVLVDNSTPSQAGELRRISPDATVLEVENRGFGAACNAGIDAALAAEPHLTHVLLLNPDAVLDPGCLDAMLATWARQPDAGAIGARILSLDGKTVRFERGRIRRYTLTRSHVAAPGHEPDIATEFITGACLLLCADLLRDGLRFDEGYFLYVEDMDLACAIAARGRTLWVARAATARHDDGGTQRDPAVLGTMRADQLRWLTAGKVRFARKWLSPWQRACFLAVAWCVKPLVGVLLWRRVGFLGAYLLGLVGLSKTRCLDCRRGSRI